MKVIDIKPIAKAENIKPEGLAENVKPKMSKVFGETQIYYQTGLGLPIGLLLTLTYPIRI